MSLAPWGDLLAAAARLGIAPEAFWCMSVQEWRLIAGGLSGASAMGRTRLQALAMAYPDQGEGDGGKR